jgi:isopentenyl phosphate kinase
VSTPSSPPRGWVPRRITLLKLGGSLITDKERPETSRDEAIRRLASEIASVLADDRRSGPPRLVIGHGSGSFGHVAAAKHRVHEGLGPVGAKGHPERLAGASEVQGRAAELHRRVLAALRREGVPAFSIAPSSVLVTDAGEPVRLATEPLRLALAAGLVPVVYGDLVMDRSRGCAIASTETVLLALVTELHRREHAIDRVLWAGVTDGVLNDEGRTIPEVSASDLDAEGSPAAEAVRAAGPAAGTDVTGGMRHRLETAVALARQGIESLIFDGTAPGRLAGALRWEAAGGTRVLPG